ncbi:MAG: CPBP family intramembrane metalloprotease [bacterium]|nr:CPBP family intramembrane metalloprotease [bacterium]
MAASWKLVLFVGLFLALYIPFVLPFFLFPDTEYETLQSAQALAGIELLAMIAVVLAALAMTRYADRRPLACVGFTRDGMLRDSTRGVLAGVILVLAVLAPLAMLGCFHLGYGHGLGSGLFWSTLSMLFNTVQQETLVHGYVQQMIRSKFGAAVGVIVSSVVMVGLHWTLFHTDGLLLLTNLFAAGVLLGCAFLISRNLWLPIGIHFGWNYLQGPILGLPVTGVDLWNTDLVYVTGSRWLTGGSVGIEGGVVASIVLVAGAAFLWLAWRRRVRVNPDLECEFP